MRISRALATLLLAAAPAAAGAEGWRHGPSGVSVPELPAGLRVGQQTDLRRDSSDVFVQLGAGDEHVTLYVYRSAFPNPALWFERTRRAMHTNVGSLNQGVAPRSFALGGASAPNGLREEIDLPAGGRFRSTAVAIGQIGEWMVKVRITSASLGRAALAERMDRLLAALRFAAVPAPLPLIVPGPCPDDNRMNGDPLARRSPETVAAATLIGAFVEAEVRGRSGLAADPGAWCRDSSEIPVEHVTVYRRRDGGAWVALLGDSGTAISAYPADLVDGLGAATFGANPSYTAVSGLYQRLPHPDRAILGAVPVAVGQSPGLARIAAGAPAGRE